MLVCAAGAATGSASAAGSHSAASTAAVGGSCGWCRPIEAARGRPLSTAAVWAAGGGVVDVTTRLGVHEIGIPADRAMGGGTGEAPAASSRAPAAVGVDAVLRGARAFERQMRAAVCAGAMPKPDVKDALPSWTSTLKSRFSARRAYGGRHSSSGAPGFLAGPADVAAGVEPESDGDGSSLAACFEAYGSSAPFSASSSVPVISDTAMKGGESVRRHTCSASSGFDCCRLLKPLVLNLLERCDPRGDPDGLVSMGGCNDTQPRPASIRAPPMPIGAPAERTLIPRPGGMRQWAKTSGRAMRLRAERTAFTA